MHRGLARFVVRRFAQAVLLVFVVSSSALVLTRLAGYERPIDQPPAAYAAELHRRGLDRPVGVLYADWLAGAVRFDFGTSLKFQRPVSALVGDRVGNTVVLGGCALILATLLGIPAGTLAGGGRGNVWTHVARGISLFFLSIPPLVTSLALLVFAAASGWFPVGGLPPIDGLSLHAIAERVRYLLLPTLALALPIAAVLERLQANAIAEAMQAPAILAARARGIPAGRVLWMHAMRLSLGPTLAVYGLIVGGLLSGSLVVEVVMSWPGLGELMYQALRSRDLYLVAGCAAAVSACLAAGVLAADIAFAFVDPRSTEQA